MASMQADPTSIDGVLRDGQAEGKSLSEQYAEFGLPVPEKTQRSRVFGVIRSYSQVTGGEWVYLVVAYIGTLVSLGLTVQRFATLEKDSDDFTFAIVLFLNTLFCAFFVAYGVWKEQPFSLLVYIMTTFLVLIYVIMNFASGSVPDVATTNGIIKLVRLIVTSALSVYLISAGLFYVYKYCDSEKFIYDLIGPEPGRKRALKLYFAFQSLLWFDLQIELSLEIMIMREGVVKFTEKEILVLAIGSVYSVVMRYVGYLAARYESPRACVFYAVSGLLPIGYVVFLFYDVQATLTASSVIYKIVLFTGSMWLGVKVLLVWVLYRLYRHFGMGIRHWVYGDPVVPESKDYRTFENEES